MIVRRATCCDVDMPQRRSSCCRRLAAGHVKVLAREFLRNCAAQVALSQWGFHIYTLGGAFSDGPECTGPHRYRHSAAASRTYI